MATLFQRLVTTAFPEQMERNVFLNNVEIIKQGSGYNWYWYGDGNNGKTTLINALIEELKPQFPSGVRIRTPSQPLEKVYWVGNNNSIHISNIPPPNTYNMVTHFRQRF